MDRAVRNVAIVATGAYLAILGAAFYLAGPAATTLRGHEANKRSLVAETMRARGRVLSSDGQVLAESATTDGRFSRRYPFGPLFSHAVGYASATYGKSGLERSLDGTLAPPPESGFWTLRSAAPRGRDVVTTLDSRLQAVAERLLTRPGAIVALDPRTGAVRCLYSFPTFDPNTIDSSFRTVAADPRKPFVDRASAGLYTPGSAFKIVTLAAHLEHGGRLDDRVPAPAVLEVGGFRVTNAGGKGYGTVTVRDAFARSINTVFAQLALRLGEEGLYSTARAFGFDTPLRFEIPAAAGRLPPGLSDPATLAWAGVGQAELLVSPLHMATIAAAVANGGIMPEPTLLAGRDVRGRRVVSEETATALREAMLGVVREGTGRRAAISGVNVAGKTGTAEVEGGAPHAWFVGFAPADEPRLVVCVVVEHGGAGGDVAARIFREFTREALGR